MSNSVFQERIKSSKVLLYLTVGVIFLIDAFLAVILGLGGELFSIGLPVLVIAVLDVVLLICVHFSNFRLKYSTTIPIIYIIVSLITGGVIVPLMAKTVITMVAFILFVVFRLVSIIALVFGVINGANRGKGVKFFMFVMTSVFLCFSAFYMYNVLPYGFYGQGFIGVRNISYEYDQTKDGYVANLIEGNKGDTIVVASEFNGKKVVGVDANIFACQDVKEIKLDCEVPFVVKNDSALKNIKEDVIISVDKEKVNEIREFAYLRAKEVSGLTSTLATSYVKFANQITPSGLSSDEVFISFDYSLADLKYANYQTIDTWIGEKGDVFSLVEHAGNLPYVGDYDLHDEEFLKENYERGGKVIDALVFEGQEIINSQINVSMPNTIISFTQIREIFIQEDNDAVYNLYNQDTAFAKGGSARYVLETDPFDMLSGIKARSGFKVSFKYSRTQAGTKYDVAQFKDALTSNLYVFPQWELDAPTITSIQKNQQSYIYGDTLNLSATATHPAGNTFEYAWKKGTASIANERTYQKTNIKPLDDSGKYVLTVTAKPDCTSLSSSASVEATINVNKKVLNFTWNKTQTQYSGVVQTIKANHVTSDVINGDVIEGYIDGNGGVVNFSSTEKNSGTYNYTIRLSGECANLYVVDSSDLTHSWTINPYSIAVTWQGTSFVYNNEKLMPSVDMMYGIGDESATYLDLYVSCPSSNATDVGSHTAKVELSDYTQAKNYKITNDNKTYNITPKIVTLTWGETSLTYNSITQVPDVLVNGVCTGDTCLANVAGGKKNVGVYTATATLSNPNYQIADGYQTKGFEILAKAITLSWSADSLVYTAKEQAPVATAQGKYVSDTIEFTYVGYGIVVGDDYTVTATIKNNNNYVISGSNSHDYSITKKAVTLTWKNTSLVYSGVAQKPSVTINGVCTGDTCVASISLNGEGINVGSYTATATISNSNYSLSSNSTAFNVTRKTLYVNAKPATITYGDVPINNGVTYSGFVNGENESVLSGTLSLSYNYVQYGNAGTYKITPSGYTASNYSISYGKGNLTVSARPLSVSIDDKESIYGTSIQTLTSSIISGNLVNGDSTPYTLTTVASSTKNAGQYDIVGSTSNSNYDISFIKGSYQINKATLTVTANAITEVTYGFSGNINYDMSWTTNNGKNPSVTGSSSVKYNTNVGEYAYSVAYDSTNYELVQINPSNFKVKVNAKKVTLSWSVQGEYTLNTYKQLKPTTDGVSLSSLALTYTYQAVTGTVVNNQATTDGKYIVTVISQNSNYELIGTLSAEFTIKTVTTD